MSLTTPKKLSSLLDKASDVLSMQQDTAHELEKIDDLKNTISAMRSKHALMKRQLAEMEHRKTVRHVVSDKSRRLAESGHPLLQMSPEAFREQSKKILEKVMRDTLRDTMELKCLAFRLTGVTLTTVEDDLVIRFDTFYENTFVKTYYVFLDQEPDSDELFIARHTVPYFIPLGLLTERYLNVDVKVFSAHLLTYLNAFVSRWQQCLALQAMEDCGVRDCRFSESLDFIDFRLLWRDRNLTFKIIYDDLSSTVPTRLAVYEAESKHRYEKIEKAFFVNDIAHAMVKWNQKENEKKISHLAAKDKGLNEFGKRGRSNHNGPVSQSLKRDNLNKSLGQNCLLVEETQSFSHEEDIDKTKYCRDVVNVEISKKKQKRI